MANGGSALLQDPRESFGPEVSQQIFEISRTAEQIGLQVPRAEIFQRRCGREWVTVAEHAACRFRTLSALHPHTGQRIERKHATKLRADDPARQITEVIREFSSWCGNPSMYAGTRAFGS